MNTVRSSRLRRGIRTAALLVLSLGAACDGGGGDGPLGPPPVTGPAPVALVEITPGTVQLPVEGTRALSAVLRAADGSVLSGRALEWASSDANVVRVDVSGNVTALREGTAVVTATSEGKQGQAWVEVTPRPGPPPVASVQVTGGGGEMEPGEIRRLGVTLRAADGTVLTGRPVAWASSDSMVVSVRPDGSIVGRRGGTATITATSEGKTGQTTVRIPDWVRYELRTVGAGALPVVIRTTADTTHVGEHAFVVKERRVRMVAGRVWFSSLGDGKYRQLYELQEWERETTHFQGNTITGPETLGIVRAVRDEGETREKDGFTGEPIYRSATFPGHWFTAPRVGPDPADGRQIRQVIPGEGTPTYDLQYTR